jgi:hypothetical protein
VLGRVTSRLALATAIAVVAACNVENSTGIAAHVAAEDSPDPQRVCATAPTPALPPAPRNLGLDPDAVAMVDANGARRTSPVFNASTINAVPSMRTSSDGRLGVGVKVGDDADGPNNDVQLFLLRPESTVTTGVGMDPVGNTIQLSSLPKSLWTSTQFPNHVRGSIRQITMCSSAITSTGSTDIYDLTLLGIADDTATSAQTYLMSVTVSIGNAKQPSATIASVTVHEVHRGANLAVPTLLEPMVTEDGKLLVGRLGGVPLSDYGWTGSTSYNIVYTYLASGLCSNAVLDNLPPMPFKPILNAPFDPALSAYGFAARPIRDAAGNVITTIGGPTTPDLSGSYPWIDRGGRNLFFTSIASKNKGSAKLRFASSACLEGDCFKDEYADQTRGVAVVGSWTNGKIVLLDGPINNIDFGAGVTRGLQQLIPLYADAPAVRFASGRENGVTTLGPTVDNMTIIDALENLPNGTPAWVPRTRREVVWKVSRGHISDEVAFDDFLDPNVFLYAPMNAVIDNAHVGSARGRYYDGYDQTDPQCQSGTGDYVGAAQVRLQNAATRPPGMGRIPTFGTISDPTNAVRVEPAALGGIHGRGLYLPVGAALAFPLDNPATGCTPVDACTDASSRTNSWYFGLFVDTRTATQFTLLSISGRFLVSLSNTAVTVTPQGGLALSVSGSGMMKRWTHLAVLYSAASNSSAPGDSKLYVYLDGELLGSVLVPVASRPLLNPDWSASTLSVSAPPTGANGIWIDELKIVLNAEWMKANHELPCNHAMGAIYATASGEHCVPYYDGSTPNGTSKRSDYIGMTTNGVSNLHYNSPRPASFASNTFCMTCHVDGGSNGIDVGRPVALRSQAIAFKHAPPFDMAKTDPRRQPMLPPRVLTGNVPAGFYGPGLPAQAKNCPTGVADDCNVDTYLLPP